MLPGILNIQLSWVPQSLSARLRSFKPWVRIFYTVKVQLSLCPTALSLTPPPVAEVWNLSEIACLVLGCLLGIAFLVVIAQWRHIRDARMGMACAGFWFLGEV